MNIISSKLSGVLLFEPKVFRDERGFFFESFNAKNFRDVLGPYEFVQDNHSSSKYGVLRGLHYQIVQPQGKLVRVVRGRVFDVAVDLRRNSPTFGQWDGVELSDDNQRMFWVPPGFAHGFVVLSDQADFLYKTTDYYAPAHERSIVWNDPDLAISWQLNGQPIVSDKDSKASLFAKADYFEN